LTGCSVFEASPARDSGYIENPERMNPWKERAGFLQRIWFKDQKELYATRERFTKIHFLPTRTDFLAELNWWDDVNIGSEKNYKDDVKEMALYIDNTLRDVFRNDPLKRFTVTESIDDSTVVYEFAIVELKPTKVVVNAAGTALGVLAPGGGIVKSTAKGSIAVEVKARDGKNNELLLAWADREIDRAAPFSFRDFSAYAHARKAVQFWAEDLLEAWNTPDSHVIEGPLPVTLNPF
jgi:hypothetical protein